MKRSFLLPAFLAAIIVTAGVSGVVADQSSFQGTLLASVQYCRTAGDCPAGFTCEGSGNQGIYDGICKGCTKDSECSQYGPYGGGKCLKNHCVECIYETDCVLDHQLCIRNQCQNSPTRIDEDPKEICIANAKETLASFQEEYDMAKETLDAAKQDRDELKGARDETLAEKKKSKSRLTAANREKRQEEKACEKEYKASQQACAKAKKNEATAIKGANDTWAKYLKLKDEYDTRRTATKPAPGGLGGRVPLWSPEAIEESRAKMEEAKKKSDAAEEKLAAATENIESACENEGDQQACMADAATVTAEAQADYDAASAAYDEAKAPYENASAAYNAANAAMKSAKKELSNQKRAHSNAVKACNKK